MAPTKWNESIHPEHMKIKSLMGLRPIYSLSKSPAGKFLKLVSDTSFTM